VYFPDSDKEHAGIEKRRDKKTQGHPETTSRGDAIVVVLAEIWTRLNSNADSREVLERKHSKHFSDSQWIYESSVIRNRYGNLHVFEAYKIKKDPNTSCCAYFVHRGVLTVMILYMKLDLFIKTFHNTPLLSSLTRDTRPRV
jgi:hypothetical protein